MLSQTKKSSYLSSLISNLSPQNELEMLINSLSRKGRERNSRDILIITKFLESTELIKKLHLDKLDELAIKRMTFFCSTYIEYLFLEKDSILFREGEIGDKFYIILSGSVSVFKLKPKIKKMNSEDYFIHLIQLGMKHGEEILKKNISLNEHVYPIVKNDHCRLEEILFLVKARKLKNQENFKQEQIEVLIKDFQRIFPHFRPKNDSNENNLKEEIDHILENKKGKFTKMLSLNRSEDNIMIEKYLYLENSKELKFTNVLQDELKVVLNKGAHFGHIALENQKNARSASILCNEDTHFGFLNQTIYTQHIFVEKEKVSNKEIHFLVDNFFPEMKFKVFKDKFFPYFRDGEVSKNNFIYNPYDSEKEKYIYFIKEGQYEITLQTNLFGLLELIEKSNEFLKEKIEPPQKFSKNDHEIKDLKKKKTFKIFINGDKQVLNLEDYFFHIGNIFSARVTSSTCRYHKILYSDFFDLTEGSRIERDFLSKTQENLCLVVKRLVNIFNYHFFELENKKNVTETHQKPKNSIFTDFKSKLNDKSLNGKQKVLKETHSLQNIKRLINPFKISIQRNKENELNEKADKSFDKDKIQIFSFIKQTEVFKSNLSENMKNSIVNSSIERDSLPTIKNLKQLKNKVILKNPNLIKLKKNQSIRNIKSELFFFHPNQELKIDDVESEKINFNLVFLNDHKSNSNSDIERNESLKCFPSMNGRNLIFSKKKSENQVNSNKKIKLLKNNS